MVSSGSSGFWFLSCVVSSVRKVWKLVARLVRDEAVDEVVDEVVEVPCGNLPAFRSWLFGFGPNAERQNHKVAIESCA